MLFLYADADECAHFSREYTLPRTFFSAWEEENAYSFEVQHDVNQVFVGIRSQPMADSIVV